MDTFGANRGEKGCRIFVTGTGTGVDISGKTLVSTALSIGLAGLGHSVVYFKPVQTGDEDDTAAVRRGAGSTTSVCTSEPAYRFPLPASPDQAAESAGSPAPTVAALSASLASLPGTDHQVVEGAGGLLVPLNAKGETWADLLLAEPSLPVLVVASSQLGTLNHTAMTLECLHSRGIPTLGVVLSGPRHPANESTLARCHPSVGFHALPGIQKPHSEAELHQSGLKLALFVKKQLEKLADSQRSNAWLSAATHHVWFPYTQHRNAPAPLPVVRARGVWLETAAGERLLDASSSWWVNTVGHGRPEIGLALVRQQRRLDHVLLAGAVHEGAALLAERLSKLAGAGLKRVFYSDNGSTAVEVALKIAYQAALNRGGEGRTLFVSFRGSYHGDTFGAMSVAHSAGFHGAFGPLLFKTLAADPVTEHPSALCPDGIRSLGPRLDALEKLIGQNIDRICGVVLEPLLQGAGGMLVQPAEFVRGVSQLCIRYKLPLILDEVFTGFGRAGANFAFQRAGVRPDLVACAKGITDLPLAATLATEELFQAFLSDDRGKALLHGHSYTANPIACAAALKALELSDSEDLPERARHIEERYRSWLKAEGASLGVLNGRALGGVLAFELPGTGSGDYFHPKASQLPALARRQGLFLRPLGNTVYLMPPLAISDRELEQALSALTATIRSLAAESVNSLRQQHLTSE